MPDKKEASDEKNWKPSFFQVCSKHGKASVGQSVTPGSSLAAGQALQKRLYSE